MLDYIVQTLERIDCYMQQAMQVAHYNVPNLERRTEFPP